jgi:hypothetical protein
MHFHVGNALIDQTFVDQFHEILAVDSRAQSASPSGVNAKMV